MALVIVPLGGRMEPSKGGWETTGLPSVFWGDSTQVKALALCEANSTLFPGITNGHLSTSRSDP